MSGFSEQIKRSVKRLGSLSRKCRRSIRSCSRLVSILVFFSYAKLNPYSGQSNNEFEGNSFNQGESVICQIK